MIVWLWCRTEKKSPEEKKKTHFIFSPKPVFPSLKKKKSNNSTMSKEASLKDFYNNPEVDEDDEDSEQDSDFVPDGKNKSSWIKIDY